MKRKNCSLCGGCIAVCPFNAITIGEETVTVDKALCRSCNLCKKICPDMSIVGELNIISMYAARSRLKKLTSVAQNGGVVSTIVFSLLKSKTVDIFLTSARDFTQPKPLVLTEAEKVVRSAGSRYFYVPILAPIRELKTRDNIGIVGLPCHIRAATNLEKVMSLNTIKIGLFCFKNFYFSSFIKTLAKYNISLNDVTKTEIVGKSMKIHTLSKTLSIKLTEFKSSEKCLNCLNFIPSEADIAVGNVGSLNNFSSVLVLTKRGAEIFEEAREYLLVSDNIDFSKITILQRIKERKRK